MIGRSFGPRLTKNGVSFRLWLVLDETHTTQRRRREYAWAYETSGDEVPDPLDAATFQSAKLDWGASQSRKGQQRLALVGELFATRHREITPRRANASFGEARAEDSGL